MTPGALHVNVEGGLELSVSSASPPSEVFPSVLDKNPRSLEPVCLE